MRSTGWSGRIRRFFGVGAVAIAVAVALSCDRADADAPPLSATRVLPSQVEPAPAEPVRVSFLVPAFAQQFGQDALVDVDACWQTVCARATVMLGDGFSAAMPATATAAEVTARIIRDTGALKVTLQVPDPGPTGDSGARSLALTVTPTEGDAGPRRPYVQVVLAGCGSPGPAPAHVTCQDQDDAVRGPAD
jgi:hypothetical protein